MTRAGDALRPILDAGAVARFRLVDVACPAGQHRLVQVIRTAHRPVMVFRPPTQAVTYEAIDERWVEIIGRSS
jgi:hypothetical protein